MTETTVEDTDEGKAARRAEIDEFNFECDLNDTIGLAQKIVTRGHNDPAMRQHALLFIKARFEDAVDAIYRRTSQDDADVTEPTEQAETRNDQAGEVLQKDLVG